MTTVYWDTLKVEEGAVGEALTMAFFEPESVLKYLSQNRNTDTKGHFTKCPAFLDYIKNVYVIRSPISITLNLDPKTRYLSISPQGQQFYDLFVLNRCDLVGDTDPPLSTLKYHYSFLADNECLIEQLPVMFHDKTVASNINVITGTYDISKWLRPLEFAFEFIDTNKPLVIKRGDPLFYIRFVPSDSKKVNLVKKEFCEEELKFQEQCVALKISLPNQILKTLYEIAKKYVPNKKKCPFNWNKK